MLSDPLSDVLALLKPRSFVSAGFEAGGDWAVRFDDQDGWIKCYAVTRGACWLNVEGGVDAVRVETGECFVLPSGRPFRLGSDRDGAAVEADTIFPPLTAGGVVRLGDGGAFALVGSRFAVDRRHAASLLGILPAILHVRSATDRGALLWAVEGMRREMQEPRPGGALMAQHLAHMMLVQALRLHVEDPEAVGLGWYLALGDRRLAASIAAMHAEPGRAWSLSELARIAGMSRSSFAVAFRDRAGETPMAYLLRWRILLASERLAQGERVSQIALQLGYRSESAFSTAFKRIAGSSPRSYVAGS